MLFYLFSLTTLLLDQLIKIIFTNNFIAGQSLSLVGKIIKLTYVKNTGAAFSIFSGYSPYLIIIGLLVAAAVIYFHHTTNRKDALLHNGLAFLLGGILGNLADRVFRGFVVDYIDFTYWPVFNLADIMIDLGVLLIIINFLSRKTCTQQS